MADIEVYSSLACRDHSKIWFNFLDHALEGKLKNWYLRMKTMCKYKNTEDTIISLNESLVED